LKKTLAKAKGYLGIQQIEFSVKNEAAIDAYQHYYTSLKDCNRAMKRLGYEN
jgi:ribosomal protein L20